MWLIVLYSLGFPPPASNTVSLDPATLALVANAESVRDQVAPGLDIHFELAKCGQLNAAYLPASHTVLLCEEMTAESPGVQRFLVAHELAHAYVDQYDIPITGSPEEAADELAALALCVTGHQSDVLDMAVWFVGHPDGGEDVTDEHQSAAKRGWTLACLEDGSENSPADYSCKIRFSRAAHSWSRLLHNWVAPAIQLR